jgi:hypothetical protein
MIERHIERVAAPEARPAPIRPAQRVRIPRNSRSVAAVPVGVAIVQAKLSVGPAGDQYEREADAVADRVVRALRSTIERSDSDGPGGGGGGDRVGDGAMGRVRRISRSAPIGAVGGDVDVDTERRITAATGGGSPLPSHVSARLEPAFGADFSGIRVHEGARAAELNDRIQARAFTTGSDIFFRDGVPDASTTSGQHLLAHELTHTIQQGAARRIARSRAPADPAATPVADRASRIQRAPGSGIIQRNDDPPAKVGWFSWLFGGSGSTATATAPAKAEPKIPAPTPTPTTPTPAALSDTGTAERVRLVGVLAELASKNAAIQPGGNAHLMNERKRLLTVLNAKALTDQVVAKQAAAVRELAESYQQAERDVQIAKDAEAADAARREEVERQGKLAEAARQALEMRAKDAAGKSYPSLRPLYGSDQALLDVLELIEPKPLQTLLQYMHKADIELVVKGQTDKGQRLYAARDAIKSKDDVAPLLAVPNLGPEELVTLLESYSSSTLIKGSTYVPDGKALVKLTASIADEAEWSRFLSEVKVTNRVTEVIAALAGATAGVADAQAQTETGYDASGLKAVNGTTIKWMPADRIAGDGAENEQACLNRAMIALENGTLARRDDHANREGNLPGLRNVAGQYNEYLVERATGTTYPGARRLVRGIANDFVYYTWTHYGEQGSPAFVRVK